MTSIPARVTVVTLGVSDLARSTAFYEALGWPLSRASVAGEVSFFRTAGGILALWGADALAQDAQVPARDATNGFRAVSLAVNVERPEDVDEAVEAVRAAGGEIVRPPARAEWGGYLAYFADPDGHLWEVTYNPGWPLGDDGLPRLP